jgi:hypothetical protein
MPWQAAANVVIRTAEKVASLFRAPRRPAARSVPTGDGSCASVVILNWRRPRNVHTILDAYVAHSRIDDIIVWNDNPEAHFAYAHPKVRCINSYDFGLNSRWLGCLAARHDCVILNDDDILCDEQTLTDFIECHRRDPDRPYTLHGRNPDEQNRYATYVVPKDGPLECDILLTRAACIDRRFVPAYFEALTQMKLTIDPATGGGEDILFSYVVRSRTGKRPLTVPGTFKELLAPHGIGSNYRHFEHRTEIMRRCQQWFNLL